MSGSASASQQPEFYPMPAFPTLRVRDLAGSARWYQHVLGFQAVYELPGSDGLPMLVHLRRARYQDILLLAAPELPVETLVGLGVALNFSVEEGLRTLANRVRGSGASAEGPTAHPWNVRELVVQDPDGYRLVFSEPIDRERPFDAVVEAIRQESDPARDQKG